MPSFFYVARDAKGEKIKGQEEGSTQEEVLSRLQAKGLIVTNILADTKVGAGFGLDKAPGGARRQMHSGITSADLTIFCRQLATLLGAGVPILKSIDIISKQVSSRRFYNTLKGLQKSMESGLSLHESMSKYPKVFSDLWVNLVDSGEASGNLAVILNRLSGYLERDAAFKSKIISALIYPAILMIAGIGALLFLTIKIIPTFADLFKGFNITLPMLTQIIILASELIRKYFMVIIVMLVIGFFIFRAYIKTPKGRRNFERFLFGLPISGEFFRALVVERFASEMATLVESGVPILYSLEITEHSVDNLVMADTVRQIREDVRGGKSLSYPLERSGFFEPMVVQMVSIGEEIGELAGMFKRIDTFYQDYVDTFLTRITSMFEPIMLVFMGLVIGIMVVGIFLPIFQISQIGGAAGG